MTALALVTAAQPLARTSEGSKSGPIGLAIILLLCVACYFLFKSMSGHLRKVREDFPANPPTAPTGGTRAVPVERTARDGSPVAGSEPPAVGPSTAPRAATGDAGADDHPPAPESAKPRSDRDQP